MGHLVTEAARLSTIANSDDWESAVEALLYRMARDIESGVMRQADYTKKTQELAAIRRLSMGQA